MTSLQPNAVGAQSETWPRCPDAAAFFERLLSDFAAAHPLISEMATRFRDRAGVNLLNLVDHWTLPATPELPVQLAAMGLTERVTAEGDRVWVHPAARLPAVRLKEKLAGPRLALGVEDIGAFVQANSLTLKGHHGDPGSRYECAHHPLTDGGELMVIARRGYNGYAPGVLTPQQALQVEENRALFRSRTREGAEEAVIAKAWQLFTEVAREVGRDLATDLFFESEREYYVARNRAASWQYAQQQLLGFGWANHDHHTYRSSRQAFRPLMQLFEAMGFIARERFYAGVEAGWGAQVLEHPVSRVVIFADVDMAPEELNIDFNAEPLPPRPTLGTIGLWCALHTSSIAQAGMHHIECEFDFARARANLEAAGFGVMKPFTDLPVLKQAFTVAETWPVARSRAEELAAQGAITDEQAERFITQGAAGSHLEILQRWEGFKGFNKTGVSSIIRDTDARKN